MMKELEKARRNLYALIETELRNKSLKQAVTLMS